ncbi:CheR family methyltransferase [Roseococcus pinisoli]|uniref:Response regulator n=1 Tax=Roseococcus pinisoli TaxID=2835040 RepID=A0ABS5QGF3_9PROT|nr:CheR family methyltransferase [Roseococcus pinisoli]MBS7812017.1 response regulator [Roseococcus pinisoli]
MNADSPSTCLAEIIVTLQAEGLEKAADLLAVLPLGRRMGFVLFLDTQEQVAQLTKQLSTSPPLPAVTAADGMPILADQLHVSAAGAFNVTAGALHALAPASRSDPRAAFDDMLRDLAMSHGAKAVAIMPRASRQLPGAELFREAGGHLIDAELALRHAGWAEELFQGETTPPARLDPKSVEARPLRARRAARRAIPPSESPRMDAAIGAASQKPEGLLGDPADLAMLEERFLPALAAARAPASAHLRVWVPGCGTGEAAYAIAMAANAAAIQAGLALQVLASDPSAAAIDQARRGIYPREAVAKIPPSHVGRYLREQDGEWRVEDALRSRIVFGTHELLHDPPFSRIDLIACPSLPGALLPATRSRVLGAFRFALNPAGLLYLPEGEEVPADAGFDPISVRPHLLRRIAAMDSARAPARRNASAQAMPQDLALAKRAAAEEFNPAAILIDAARGVAATVGPVERFAEVAIGDTPEDLLSHAAPWLRRGLSHAVTKAWRTGQDQSWQALRPGTDSIAQPVAIRARHLRDGDRALLLVSLHELPVAAPAGAPQPSRPIDPDLAEESETLREAIESQRLQLAALRQQASLAREEALSLQEELASAHAQLEEERRRQRGVERLQDILRSCGIAMLVLDPALSIRFFTSSPLLPFRMIPGDIGRPLADIAPLVDDPDLLEGAARVLATRGTASRELEGPDGAWLMRRIHPCLDRHEAVTGLVVTYADIRETKAAGNRADALRGMAADIVQSYGRPVVMMDANLHVVFANDAFHETFGSDDGHDDENTLRLLIGPALRAVPHLATFLTGRDDRFERIEDCVIQATLPAMGLRTLRLAVSRVPPGRTLIVVEDVTERVVATAGLEKAKAAAERANREKSRLLATISQELRPSLRDIEELSQGLREPEGPAGLTPKQRGLEIGLREMSGILDALQDGARLDLGTFNMSSSTFALGALLEEIDLDFTQEVRARGLRWRVLASERVVVSDAQLLHQVLRNLISVLLRYTATGRILVGCRRRGELLGLEVWSEGLQIPLPVLRASFDPRVDGPAFGESADASRFGLEVAHRLSELLGHPIRLETRVPGTPAFIMELPTAARPATRLLSGGDQEGQRPILIVGEMSMLADSLRLLLEQDGYTAMLATDAPYAIGLAVEHPPALIVAEYELPGRLTGLDLARRIGDTQDPPPPAILLTGDLPAALLHDIASADFTHVPESIRPEELLELIRRQLPRASAPATMPASLGRIFIVNSDATSRLAMGEWLQNHGWVTECFASAEVFLDSDTPERRGCVLVDWSLAGMGGLALLGILRPLSHRLPVIMLAEQGDIRLAVRAISEGAIDFIKRPVQYDALLRSIEKAMLKVAASAQHQASRTELTVRLASLTQRQREILERIVAGMPNKIIAAELNLSQRTVENHRAALMSKLGARSLSELIRIVVAAP